MGILERADLPSDDPICKLVDDLVNECRRRGADHVVTIWADGNGTFGILHPAMPEGERMLMAEELEIPCARAARSLALLKKPM